MKNATTLTFAPREVYRLTSVPLIGLDGTYEADSLRLFLPRALGCWLADARDHVSGYSFRGAFLQQNPDTMGGLPLIQPAPGMRGF